MRKDEASWPLSTCPTATARPSAGAFPGGMHAGDVPLANRAGQAMQAELRSEPVFRYSDNVRRFPDASAWLWHISGRPVAVCKLERLVGADVGGWQYCFVSLSDQLTTAKWGSRFEWRARKPGLTWSAVPQARQPQATATGRLLQMREIARRFEATCAWNMQSIYHLIAPAMIRASYLDHIFLFRECPCRADRSHHTFSA